jgi:hypothetical protein
MDEKPSRKSMDRDTARAIEWDCAQLLIRFYNLLDAKRYEDMANLFADDGVWVRLGKELVGPVGILNEMKERDDWLTAHVVSNIDVKIIDADRADTSQYVTLYRHENWKPSGGPAPVIPPMGILHHRDQLVRVDGVWKFKRKTSRAIMVNRDRITHYDKK